jgi:hypothetical protein
MLFEWVEFPVKFSQQQLIHPNQLVSKTNDFGSLQGFNELVFVLYSLFMTGLSDPFLSERLLLNHCSRTQNLQIFDELCQIVFLIFRNSGIERSKKSHSLKQKITEAN